PIERGATRMNDFAENQQAASHQPIAIASAPNQEPSTDRQSQPRNERQIWPNPFETPQDFIKRMCLMMKIADPRGETNLQLYIEWPEPARIYAVVLGQ